MDHVVGGDQETDLLVDRYDDRVVDFQQVVLTLLGGTLDLLTRGGQYTEETDVLVEVIVLPLPLEAGDLDGHIGVARVLEGQQGGSSRDGHADQHQERDGGPDDLDGGAFVEGGGDGALGLAVGHQRVDQHGEDAGTDHYTDPEDQHVQVIDLVADFGYTFPEIQGVHVTCGGIACTKQYERAPETAQGASECISEHALLSLRPGYRYF